MRRIRPGRLSGGGSFGPCSEHLQRADTPVCSKCGSKAACFGEYEGVAPAFSCEMHCWHGPGLCRQLVGRRERDTEPDAVEMISRK